MARRPARGRLAGGLVNNLQVERLSPAYRGRLLHACAVMRAVMRSWALERHIELETLVGFPDNLNIVLVQFLQNLFDVGASVSLATHAVLAVQTQWRFRTTRLLPAWDN